MIGLGAGPRPDAAAAEGVRIAAHCVQAGGLPADYSCQQSQISKVRSGVCHRACSDVVTAMLREVHQYDPIQLAECLLCPLHDDCMIKHVKYDAHNPALLLVLLPGGSEIVAVDFASAVKMFAHVQAVQETESRGNGHTKPWV